MCRQRDGSFPRLPWDRLLVTGLTVVSPREVVGEADTEILWISCILNCLPSFLSFI